VGRKERAGYPWTVYKIKYVNIANFFWSQSTEVCNLAASKLIIR
jgi:hypothetical protein